MPEQTTEKNVTWEMACSLLQEFIDLNKREPKRKEIYKGYKIGDWCHIQRKRYNNHTLSDGHIKKLSAIGLRLD